MCLVIWWARAQIPPRANKCETPINPPSHGGCTALVSRLKRRGTPPAQDHVFPCLKRRGTPPAQDHVFPCLKRRGTPPAWGVAPHRLSKCSEHGKAGAQPCRVGMPIRPKQPSESGLSGYVPITPPHTAVPTKSNTSLPTPPHPSTYRVKHHPPQRLLLPPRHKHDGVAPAGVRYSLCTGHVVRAERQGAAAGHPAHAAAPPCAAPLLKVLVAPVGWCGWCGEWCGVCVGCMLGWHV